MANSNLSKLVVGGLAALAVSCGGGSKYVRAHTEDINNSSYSPEIRKQIALHDIQQILGECSYRGETVRYWCNCEPGWYAGERGINCVQHKKSKASWSPVIDKFTLSFTKSWNEIGALSGSNDSGIYEDEKLVLVLKGKQNEDFLYALKVYLGRK